MWGFLKRKIEDIKYVKYLLQYLNVGDLKQICRDFEVKGFSSKKKSDLIDFINDSLAEEELVELLQQKELEIISHGIELALKKIRGEDRENLTEIKIINQEEHEIELLFKGFNWETKSFLSITSNNMDDPERDCDCRIGSNLGFCSHFWVGFIYSLKQVWFKLSDWTLTVLPEDFENKIRNVELAKEETGDSGENKTVLTGLIDNTASSAIIMRFIDSSISVYESEITKVVERESEFQGNVTRYFLVNLKESKIGKRLKKKSDYREEETEIIDDLKVRVSEKLQSENSFVEGERINFNGKLVKDNFWGFMVKNVRKIVKL